MVPDIMVRARYKGLCPRAKVRARESSKVRARHLIWRGPADMALEIMVSRGTRGCVLAPMMESSGQALNLERAGRHGAGNHGSREVQGIVSSHP